MSQPGRLAAEQSVVARRRTNAGPLLVVLGAALVLRVVVAGTAGAASEGGAALFAVLLVGAAVAAGWRPGRLRLSGVAWGVLGAVGLVAGPVALHFAGPPHPSLHAASAGFPLWAVVVTGVALAEELLLRGALFTAIDEAVGLKTALVVTTIVFALVHLPLYGVSAMPLDLAVGLGLGGLRVVSGGVTAPATAHVLADLAGWWLW